MLRKLLIRIGSIVVAGAVVQSVAAGKSMALDLDFSFTNVDGTVTGTVTGVILGLMANESNVSNDVQITSYPSGINIGAEQALPAASNQNPWDIANAVALGYENDSSITTDANGDITGGAIQIVNGYNGLTLNPAAQYAVLYVNNGDSGNFVQNDLNGFTTSPATSVVPWSDPSGGSLPAIGAVLGIGVMRKAKQFQKAKVGSSQLEKV